jgi:hypothetical protein
MNACNFEHLLQFVNKQLDLDKQLEVYDHLDRCDICRDAVHQLSRDLNGAFLVYCAHCANQYARRRHVDAATSGHALVSARVTARALVRRSATRQ